MTGVVRRVRRMLERSLRTLLAPAEDPRQTFGAGIEPQYELLEQVWRALADITAAKQQLESRIAEIRRKLPELDDQARRALLTGRDDIARLALRRRQLIALEAQRLEDQAREATDEEQRLAVVEQRLAARVAAYRAHTEVLAARRSAAQAHVRINEALAGLSREAGDLRLTLERAERETELAEARASGIDRLIEDGTFPLAGDSGNDALERRFALMEVDEAVEERLADLRRQLDGEGSGVRPGQ